MARGSSGDRGTTIVGSGHAANRMPKNHVLVEFSGALDEAQVALGFAIVESQAQEHAHQLSELTDCLVWMQRQIFASGTIVLKNAPMDAIADWSWDKLLEEVERCNNYFAPTKPIRDFILPGGSELAARIEFVRVAIRRVERSYCACSFPDRDALPFYNRLSKLAFTLARHSNEVLEAPETLL
ncbi:MAG: hypothetical protein FWC81_01065 [Coriobacteriia bacterium]|nr:hypothetical protein [Coriobacteriia bacterium]